MNKPILTITMNPSVDISYTLDALHTDDVNRVDKTLKSAGGKGLNVARVINQLQEPVLTTGLLGGFLGDFINDELKKASIPANFFKIKQESRN